MLSIIKCYENKIFDSNKIYITPELVGQFKDIWNKLVITNHAARFALPFYHLKSEPFWKLYANSGFEKWLLVKSTMRSMNNLQIAVAYAEIDKELFEILQNEEQRKMLSAALLDKYFPATKNNFDDFTGYLYDITNDILNENRAVYQQKIHALTEKLSEEEFETEIFVRKGIFKQQIAQIYQQTCCISKLKVATTYEISVIDACHIIPFSVSHDDTITNGIALSPTLHRAFDRGLLTINQNYEVQISSCFVRNSQSHFLHQFDGKIINLPKHTAYFPNLEGLQWHERNVFKK